MRLIHFCLHFDTFMRLHEQVYGCDCNRSWFYQETSVGSTPVQGSVVTRLKPFGNWQKRQKENIFSTCGPFKTVVKKILK